jgi:hypothetical protein
VSQEPAQQHGRNNDIAATKDLAEYTMSLKWFPFPLLLLLATAVAAIPLQPWPPSLVVLLCVGCSYRMLSRSQASQPA